MSRKRNRKAPRSEIQGAASSSKATGALPEALGYQPADWRLWLPLSVVVLVLSAWFLFFRLGHYPLWGDEADTALHARGVARTGDTFAMLDHNICAFRNGLLLKNLRARYTPPDSFYLAAPFVGAEGTSSLWPRMPFAICGLLSVALILYWMYRSRVTAAAWIVMSIALLCNVSFFLYCRQCRYYSMAILLSLVIVYLYLNWNGRRSGIVWMMLASILLLSTHYLAYAGLYAVLACDYLLFGRRDHRLKLGQWLLLIGPQILVGIVTVWIYNPIGNEAVPNPPGRNLLLDKLTLISWHFRDINSCEFCVGIVMLAAPVLYYWKRNIWLLRGSAAIVVYLLVAAILSPQPVAITGVADVRYISAMIPLCIGLSALVVVLIAGHNWKIALPLAVAVFALNVLNHPIFPNKWSCRPYDFAHELCTARPTSIDVAVKWINDNVHKGESIWVLPDYMRYGLMYHAPDPVYAWQLDYKRKEEEQFKNLPLIHFIGQAPPDYFIFFGRSQADDKVNIKIPMDKIIQYQLVKIFDIFWNDMTRPEIFWRSFRPVENFNRQFEAVYVYQRVTPWPGK